MSFRTPEARVELDARHRRGGLRNDKERRMATRIVFTSGIEVTAAQEEADVVHAVRRDHPNPVTLESTAGRPLYINWEHVAFIEETPAESPIGA